ncbi:MAG: hypothetical protein ACFFBW_12595 [Promethearchaeota archaeon]
MPYNVAFDIAHKPRGKIDENLTELRDFLNANDFICYNFLETPVTQNSLQPYDILVFVCPDFAKISSMEITEIMSWVKEDGGGLLLLSHAGGDKGRNSNLSELSQNFGIIFENDQVLDESYNLGMENMPIITSFVPPHPITTGISSICYRSGCSLSIMGSAISIASSNDTSEPISTPLICTTEPEKGRVCAIGSYEMFRDKVGGGFNYEEHPNLTFNIFNWLVSDYRMELRTSGRIPEVTPPDAYSYSQTTGYPTSSNNSATYERKKIDIDFSMKISKKSELMELLKIFQNQIDMIKNTIDKLIKATEASDKEIIELSNPASHVTSTFEGSNLADTSNKQIIPDSKPTPLYDFLDLASAPEPVLTDLPPKPESFKDKEEKNFIGLPRTEGEVKLKPLPKLKTKSKIKRKDLEAESEVLKSKLNSYRNLMNLVEKKLKAGEINKKARDKRIGQIKADIQKTQERIDEIKNLL